MPRTSTASRQPGRGRWNADNGHVALRRRQLRKSGAVGVPVQDQLGAGLRNDGTKLGAVQQLLAALRPPTIGRMMDEYDAKQVALPQFGQTVGQGGELGGADATRRTQRRHGAGGGNADDRKRPAQAYEGKIARGRRRGFLGGEIGAHARHERRPIPERQLPRHVDIGVVVTGYDGNAGRIAEAVQPVPCARKLLRQRDVRNVPGDRHMIRTGCAQIRGEGGKDRAVVNRLAVRAP